jgi:hypothetical protein
MAIVKVHPIVTTPEWWEIAGYHPRDIQVDASGLVMETISGVLRDDGPKPLGADRKLPKCFRVSHSANTDLVEMAGLLALKVEAGEDITDVFFA